jgi:hypothetical protein
VLALAEAEINYCNETDAESQKQARVFPGTRLAPLFRLVAFD